MARVAGVDPSAVEASIRQVFEARARQWGGPLLNHLLYARRPTIFRGVRAMWSGLDASGLIAIRACARCSTGGSRSSARTR